MKGKALLLGILGASLLATCGAPRSAVNDEPARGSSYGSYLASGDRTPGSRPEGTSDADSMVVHTIDIGQGLAVLLEFPCGAALVDTGGEQNAEWDSVGALKIYLDRFFARRPDLERTFELLLITHPHLDHTRGIDMVLRNYKVNNVIDNGMRNEWMEFDGKRMPDQGGRFQIALDAWAKSHSDSVGFHTIAVEQIGKDGKSDGVIDPIQGCGRATTDPQITVLWGQLFTDRETFGDNPNDHSVALRVDYGASSLFIPGDLEYVGNSRLEKKYAANKALLDVDMLIVGHHGSKNATTQYMMENMSPKVAVISAGPYERRYPWTGRVFGHPNQKAINFLTHPDYGVSWKRAKPIDAMVGQKGAWKDEVKEQFARRRIDDAVYCTCWDGNVRMRANANGWIDVEFDGRE